MVGTHAGMLLRHSDTEFGVDAAVWRFAAPGAAANCSIVDGL